MPGPEVKQKGGKSSRPTAAPRSTLKRIVNASRLPRLPREQLGIIVRPRGGLDVKTSDLIQLARALAMAAALAPEQVRDDTVCPNGIQNIIVISTPHEANARAYARIQRIHTTKGPFDVAAYVAASDDTCKGVVRGVNPEISDADLKAMIINHRNPQALEVRRIKKTPTIVVLFEGHKVPNHVVCGTVMLPCALYRRQVDHSHSRSRDHSHSRSRERSHSSVRIQKGPTWADKVKGKTNGQKVTEATLPEQKEDPRIVALKQENAQLKEEMRKLRADLELIRKAQNGQGSTSPAPTLKPVLGKAKRKAPPPSRPRSRWSRWRRRPGPRPP
ncbi:hypothetical protein MTO96_027259 [Rhipicephalus appendiculatus]